MGRLIRPIDRTNHCAVSGKPVHSFMQCILPIEPKIYGEGQNIIGICHGTTLRAENLVVAGGMRTVGGVGGVGGVGTVPSHDGRLFR